MTEICKQNGIHEQTENPTPEALTYTPRFDVAETNEALILYGDLPGVDREDLEITFEDRELAIHGKVAPRHPDKEHLRGEYGIGDFRRRFMIDESVDADQISAELKNGILTIRLPKSSAARTRRVEIKSA